MVELPKLIVGNIALSHCRGHKNHRKKKDYNDGFICCIAVPQMLPAILQTAQLAVIFNEISDVL